MHLGELDMGLTDIKLGKYIELYSEPCNISNLTNDDVSGVNKDKEFFEPSIQVGNNTSKYKIVPPGYFACNLMHVGRDVVLPIAYNHSTMNKIVSPAYHVFKFIENDEILSEYFFLCLKSSERDRFFWFNTDSSIRDGLSWNDFIDVVIELPPLPIQQKYVDVYNAMLANQESYEQGLEDLKLVCEAYIEKLKREIPSETIKPYIELMELKNSDEKYGVEAIKGISINKEFIDTKANTNNLSPKNYKIVSNNCFAFNPNTARMGDKFSIALNKTSKDILVSSIYPVFCIKNSEKIIPEYLLMFFMRSEFDRYVRFNSWGSARETFNYNDIELVKIPLPDIIVQKAIVNIFHCYAERKEINEQLKKQIKDICPLLVKGSIDEAKNTKEA